MVQSTISDGFTNQSYVNYVFSTPGKSTQVDENSNKAIILSHESDFDSWGRINETKTLSPTGTVLATVITHYDNFSNAIYAKDTRGHETWFAYANTNTTNSFPGASGFTNSFYTNNTISSNIHDLLVGQASYQNGAGTNKSESYFNYNGAGELVHQKVLHNSAWLVSSSTYDKYGNRLTSTDPLGRTTYFQYSSAYDYAYLTQQSILLSGGGSAGVFALDGKVSFTIVNGAQNSGSLTTTNSSDVIVLFTVNKANAATVSKIKDSASLTWKSRLNVTISSAINEQEFYALAPTALTSDSITVTMSSSTAKTAVGVFAVSGANSTSFFDGSPVSNTATTGGTPKASISTNNANDFIFGLEGNTGSTLESVCCSFTNIVGTSTGGYVTMRGEKMIVIAKQTGLSVQYGTSLSGSTDWIVIADAIKAASSGGTMQNVSTSYSYNFTSGLETSVTDPNGHATNYAYDRIGRLNATIYPLVNQVAAETTYSYNDTKNYVSTTDPNGNQVRQYFDGLNRLINVVAYNGSVVYSNQSYTYNYLDLKASYTTANGNSSSYSYDSLGFMTRVTNPDSSFSTASYNYQNNTKTVTDENGHKTVFAYDWMRNLIWVREYNSSSGYYLTSYSYDLAANLLSVTDAKNQVTSYQYDDLNRLIVTKYPDGTNATRSYDNVGNLLATKDPSGNTVTFAYDQLNRVSNVSYPSGAKVVYSYDAAGNELSMSGNAQSATSSSSVTFTYDARNRVVTESDVIGGSTYNIKYYYDKASNIVALDYPDNYNLTYSYDVLNRIANVGNGIAVFKYTVDNKISTISYSNGVVTSYSYDKRDRPTLILSKKGATTLQSLSYSYDAVGNVLSVNSPSYNYTYDNLNRLTYSAGPWGKLNYTYDAVGNRVKSVAGAITTTYLYSSYNRLTQENTSTWTATLTYDNNGNLKKLVNGSTTWNYYFDSLNQLTGVSKNGAKIQNNTYDASGRRIEQNSSSSSTIVYVYQGANILYQKNLSSSVITKSFYANGMQVGQLVGSTSYYLQQDNIGSTRLATTSTGSVQLSSNYLPFGSSYSPSGSGIYFLFTGKLIDALTGLYYFGARYYDPVSGRFITEDSKTGSTTDPQSNNRYMYARDNPLAFVDPSGNKFITPTPNYYLGSSPPPPPSDGCGYFGCVSGSSVYGTGSSSDGCGYFGCVSGSSVYGTWSTTGSTTIGSTTSGSGSGTGTGKLGFRDWLYQKFILNHLGDIAIAVTGILTAVLGLPVYIPTSLIESLLISGTYASLITALSSDDTVAIAGALAGAAAATLGAYVATLSALQYVGFSIAVGGINFAEALGSVGVIDAIRAGTAVGIAATEAGYLLSSLPAEWNQYQSSS